ncbi:MAG TPA: prolyl oligopeptidase family serine peptidase [Chthoniobacteraceae bacterium]|nr:prolyl oligopeptidase family serine peptidase [Chthoniobacteraceae bacterium]
MSDAFEEFTFRSSLDGSQEPSLLWWPETKEPPAALIVVLHTWSADRFNMGPKVLDACRERGWALLLPEFRGPNLVKNPRAREAGGSALARRDIIDATRHLLSERFERKPFLFLMGGSGGGHMSLQVAGREDFRWDAVSSWCPITDLVAWQGENPNYRPHIEAVCGGAPGDSPEIDAEYHERSPLHVASALAKCRLLLAHGREDRSVPYTHGWRMAQAIEACGPEAFYFSLFAGGHELRHPVAFDFFDGTIKAAAAAELTG